MLYRLCNNGRAILLSRGFGILEKILSLELENASDPCTAVIKCGARTFYRTFNECRAELEKELIAAGPIKIAIIRNNEIKPTWICDELYAAIKGDVVAVGGNTLEYDKLLTELRVENDNFRERMAHQEEELAALRKHYEDIYAGYQIL